MDNPASFFHSKHSLTCRGQVISLQIPIVMGIINITPDSFYGASQFRMKSRISHRAKHIVASGGTIIDVGACSTRPNSTPVSQDEELKRLSKALSTIRRNHPEAIVSVDTYRAGVAKRVVKDFDVDIINDISAGELDPGMFETVAQLNVPYIAMHMQGSPQNMQNNPRYDDVVKDIIKYFATKVEKLKSLGIKDIIIDPGFAFGKNIEHNYTLLKNLDTFRLFDLPILVGISRKSMIYKTLNTLPEGALNGTTVLNTIALLKGANILRVHDVTEAVETIKLVNLTQKQKTIE